MQPLKHNRTLFALIQGYKKQNTKGFKGLKKIISEEITIFKNSCKIIWLKYFKAKWH